MSGAWSQLEQLLTCAICLDRFRNPKLLPCQHTFCGEPCMEGLVDYARRQIKCPECRAEHRIPYNGVQSFPNNVTLTRFLDLHRSITGEEPEPLPSQMDRCNVCGEKSYCNGCSHCGKKVCDECRTAHLDILRREINRINSQIRRGLDNLSEHAEQANKGNEKLLSITSQIRDEITESVRRLVKDLKDRETKLLEELDEFTINETKNSGKLKEDFEIELATITSNSELADEHITETDEWTDAELMEFKDIFMKTLDFLRNLDTDSMDYSRKIKYIQKVDLDSIRRNVADFGEIRIIQSSLSSNFLSPLSPADSTSNLAIPQSSLMRSQSDHRLAQFASTTTTPSSRSQRSDPLQRSYLDVTSGQNKYGSDSERERGNSPPGGGRRIEGSVRFGSVHERSSTTRNNNDFGYTRGWQRPGDSDYEPSNSANFRSRFMRERIRERTAGTTNDDHSFDDHDSDLLSGHRVRFQEESSSSSSTTKPKLFDTEEMANMRTPLSGLIKLSDSPHLMERLHQNEIKAKQKAAEVKENESSMTTTTTNATMPPITNVTSTPNPTPVHRPARQISEDEIEKQKKQNQAAFTQTQQQSTITTNNNTSTPRTITTTNRSSDNNNSSNSSTNITNTSTSVTNRRIQAIQQEEKRSPSSSDDNSDDLNYDDDNVTTTTRPTTTNSSARRRIYASSHVTSGGNSNQSANNFSQSTEYGGESSSRNKYSQSSSYGLNTGNTGSNNRQVLNSSMSSLPNRTVSSIPSSSSSSSSSTRTTLVPGEDLMTGCVQPSSISPSKLLSSELSPSSSSSAPASVSSSKSSTPFSKSPTNSSTSTFNNNNQSASTSKSAYYNNKKHNNKSSNIYGASGSSSSSGGGGGGCVGGSSGISGIGISDMYDNNYDDINPTSYSSSSTTATHNRHNESSKYQSYVPSSRYHHRHRYQHYSSSPSIHITSDTLSSSKNSTTSSPPQRNLSPIPSISSNEQTPYGSAANSTQPSPLPPPTLSASNVPTSPESEQTEEEEEKEPEDIETNNESSAKTSPSESPQPQHSIAGTTTSSILYKPSSSPTQTTAIQTSSSNRDDVEIVTQKGNVTIMRRKRQTKNDSSDDDDDEDDEEENVQRNDENEMDDRPRLYRVNSSDNRFNGELAIPSQLNWLRPSVESQFSSTKNNTDNRQVNQDHVNDGQEEEEEAGDDDDDEYEYVDEEIEDEEENDNEIIYLPGQQEDNNRYLNVKTIENNNELSEESEMSVEEENEDDDDDDDDQMKSASEDVIKREQSSSNDDLLEFIDANDDDEKSEDDDDEETDEETEENDDDDDADDDDEEEMVDAETNNNTFYSNSNNIHKTKIQNH
ncbi:Zinc ion binding, variant 2 [Dermatophagoides farinae]|uniref:Zinc ion binding, variant 2 n=1 Tax=Dermatophagoides farinae TaxID=6954 RepID=A0A922HZ71_DERFA|nr:Zinc ion binding, variant 2 [Dermatophagoides farinae]